MADSGYGILFGIPYNPSELIESRNCHSLFTESICHLIHPVEIVCRNGNYNLSHGAKEIPAPTSSVGKGKLPALRSNSRPISAGAASGNFLHSKAAIPATCGVAMLVPESVRYLEGMGQDE